MRPLTTVSRALLLAAAALAQAACLYNNHARWWVGDVAPDWHDCRAIAGTHAVLDLQKFRSIVVVPFAWGGYRLFVITEPPLLEAGASLTIPSGEAKAILCDFRHGAPGDPITGLTGTVTVLRERGRDLLVELDLDQPGGHWSLSGKHWLKREQLPVEHPRNLR